MHYFNKKIKYFKINIKNIKILLDNINIFVYNDNRLRKREVKKIEKNKSKISNVGKQESKKRNKVK